MTTGLPSLTEQLYTTAKEIYGRDCIAAEIGYKRSDEKGRWQAYVCVISDRSIFEDGATPQAAYDAAVEKMRFDSVKNLETVLGCKLVKAA